MMADFVIVFAMCFPPCLGVRVNGRAVEDSHVA
jgi:hypothetical protein